MQPMVSIVMPFYNSEKTIGNAITSLINQTYSNLEIICVDDGSSDGSLDILQDFCKHEKRITLIHQNNMYAGIARNNGMKLAKGKYIIFLDSDDYFYDSMIEKMVKCAENSQADIVLCDGYLHDEITDEKEESTFILNKEILSGKEVFSPREIKDSLFEMSTTAPWNKLFLTDFVMKNKILFQGLRSNNDIYFSCVTLMLANVITYTTDKLLDYNVNNINSLQVLNRNNCDDFLSAFKAVYTFVDGKEDVRIYDDALKRICFMFLVHNLQMIGTYDLYKDYYEKTKSELLESVFKGNKSIFNDQYYGNLFNSYVHMTAEEYLYSGYKYEHKRQIDLCQVVNDLSEDAKELNTWIDELKHTIEKKTWCFPYEKIQKGARIVLYCAGDVGNDYYRQIKDNNYCEIVAWVDKKYELIRGGVVDPMSILELNYDNILIANSSAYISNQIREELIQMGIDAEKMIFPF